MCHHLENQNYLYNITHFVYGWLFKKKTKTFFCDKLFKQVTINKRLRVKSVKIG